MTHQHYMHGFFGMKLETLIRMGFMTIPLSGGNWKMKLNHLGLSWQTRMDLPSLPFWKPIYTKTYKTRTHRNQPRMSSKPRCFDFETAWLNNNKIWTLLLVPFTAIIYIIFRLIKYGNLRGCTIAKEVLWGTGSLKNAWFPVLCIIWDTLYRSMALLTWESWWPWFQPSQWFEEAWPSRWFMGWDSQGNGLGIISRERRPCWAWL